MTLSQKTNLADILHDPSLLKNQAFWAGKWHHAKDGASFDVVNPARGDTLAQVSDLDRADTAEAIDAADRAMPAWAGRSAKDRAGILHRWHDLILENQDDLARIMTAEMGKPLDESRAEVAYGAGFVDWFAEEGRRVYGEIIPPHHTDKRLSVIKQPIGVVGAITPWNFPIAMITRKAAPALAAGCAFLVKPADAAPLSALALAVLAERAGVPAGIFSVLTSRKAANIGQEFTDHPKVRKLTFTGSTRVGKILLRQAADQVMKCSMELGGNAPFIVFDDADLDAAVAGALVSKFRNNGQTCVCANRIYVQDAIYEPFSALLANALGNKHIGDGLLPGTDFGPLISSAALHKVQEHVADALSKGAKLICGGKAHSLGGTFYSPTILGDVTEQMQITQEETFGPVAPLLRFTTEAEVIARANDTPFGLASYFYARDINRITRVQEALEYGIVGVNTGLISTEIAPFGGMKQSGLGREGSRHGIEEYLEMKYICLGIH